MNYQDLIRQNAETHRTLSDGMSGIARLEARIEGLEAMIKRIAAHLGIEG